MGGKYEKGRRLLKFQKSRFKRLFRSIKGNIRRLKRGLTCSIKRTKCFTKGRTQNWLWNIKGFISRSSNIRTIILY